MSVTILVDSQESSKGKTVINPTASVAEALRSELKAWEKAFAQAHEGRKPARADIKADTTIAQKYKAYNSLMGRVSEASNPNTTKHITTPRAGSKRRRNALGAEADKENLRPGKSPRKSWHRHESTHSHPTNQDADSADEDELNPWQTPTAHRVCVGPTPQKNGTVLGLFDLLSPASAQKVAVSTPSKRNTAHTLGTPLARRSTNVSVLPPLPQAQASSQTLTPAKSHARSSSQGQPTTSPVRQTVTTLVTPTKLKTPSAAHIQTPSSSDTPAFLKRHAVSLFPRAGKETNQTCADTELDALLFSPVPVRRIPPQPAGKPLSQLCRGLRELEEERLDDELDALREMEAEEAGIAVPARLVQKNEGKTTLQAEENEWPLGADGAALEAEGKDQVKEGEDGKRRWKKKGQKRTTRKANIGVSTKRWEAEPEWNPGKEETKGDGEDGAYTGEDKKNKAKGRTISAAAHANFRALKIKNKGSKAKRGGRFGRR